MNLVVCNEYPRTPVHQYAYKAVFKPFTEIAKLNYREYSTFVADVPNLEKVCIAAAHQLEYRLLTKLLKDPTLRSSSVLTQLRGRIQCMPAGAYFPKIERRPSTCKSPKICLRCRYRTIRNLLNSPGWDVSETCYAYTYMARKDTVTDIQQERDRAEAWMRSSRKHAGKYLVLRNPGILCNQNGVPGYGYLLSFITDTELPESRIVGPVRAYNLTFGEAVSQGSVFSPGLFIQNFKFYLDFCELRIKFVSKSSHLLRKR